MQYVWNVHYSFHPQPAVSLLFVSTYLHLPYLLECNQLHICNLFPDCEYYICHKWAAIIIINVLMLLHNNSKCQEKLHNQLLEQKVVSSHRMVKANFEVIYYVNALWGIVLSSITIFHLLSNPLNKKQGSPIWQWHIFDGLLVTMWQHNMK